MSKDLGEELENLEENIENLKNKEFRLFGIKMTAVTISAAIALVSSGIGTLYGAFVVYNDYMSMKEIIMNIDVAAIDAKNAVIETKLDEAMSYTKDIKNSLKGDIVRLETDVDRIDGKVSDSEQRVKDAQSNIESGIDTMRSENNQMQKDVTESIREVEANNRTIEKDLRAEMRQLELDLNEKLQEALNNPLSK